MFQRSRAEQFKPKILFYPKCSWFPLWCIMWHNVFGLVLADIDFGWWWNDKMPSLTYTPILLLKTCPPSNHPYNWFSVMHSNNWIIVSIVIVLQFSYFWMKSIPCRLHIAFIQYNTSSCLQTSLLYRALCWHSNCVKVSGKL